MWRGSRRGQCGLNFGQRRCGGWMSWSAVPATASYTVKARLFSRTVGGGEGDGELLSRRLERGRDRERVRVRFLESARAAMDSPRCDSAIASRVECQVVLFATADCLCSFRIFSQSGISKRREDDAATMRMRQALHLTNDQMEFINNRIVESVDVVSTTSKCFRHLSCLGFHPAKSRH